MRRLNDRVGIERDRVDAFLNEELSELRIIRRSLAADADLLSIPDRGFDRECDHLLDRTVTLVEQVSDHLRITVEPERKLRQVVRPDRVAVEDFQELIGKNDVRRQLAHRVDLKIIFALYQTILR